MLNMWPDKLMLNDEKLRHVGLAQQKCFGHCFCIVYWGW